MKGPAEIAHGPILIGFTFNVFLYGITVAQAYMYYTTYKMDRPWIKIFILVLLIADTTNTIFDLIYLYRSLIVHYGNISHLTTANWLFATDPALTGIIASLVQSFYAWRIYILTHNLMFVGPVVISAVSGLGGAIATAVEVMYQPHFVDFRKFKSVVILWLVSETIGDIIITIVLVTYFKHKSGFPSSNLMVDRIIRLTIQTGLVTSTVAMLDLIFFLVDPTGTHLIFNLPLCKLYTNSLMSSLNARQGWKFCLTASSATDSKGLCNAEISTIGGELNNSHDLHSSLHERSAAGEDPLSNPVNTQLNPPPNLHVRVQTHSTNDDAL